MTREELENLGWKLIDIWNNREIFSLSDDSKFALVEHNGDYGILDPYKKDFSIIYCDMTDEEIMSFTKKAKIIDDVFAHPKDHTVYEYITAETEMRDLVNKLKKK